MLHGGRNSVFFFFLLYHIISLWSLTRICLCYSLKVKWLYKKNRSWYIWYFRSLSNDSNPKLVLSTEKFESRLELRQENHPRFKCYTHLCISQMTSAHIILKVLGCERMKHATEFWQKPKITVVGSNPVSNPGWDYKVDLEERMICYSIILSSNGHRKLSLFCHWIKFTLGVI